MGHCRTIHIEAGPGIGVIRTKSQLAVLLFSRSSKSLFLLRALRPSWIQRTLVQGSTGPGQSQATMAQGWRGAGREARKEAPEEGQEAFA